MNGLAAERRGGTGERDPPLLQAVDTVGDAQSLDDLGPCFAGDLTGAELRYLVENEWAQTADDVLWRRSKLGLKATPEDRTAISQFIASLSG